MEVTLPNNIDYSRQQTKMHKKENQKEQIIGEYIQSNIYKIYIGRIVQSFNN